VPPFFIPLASEDRYARDLQVLRIRGQSHVSRNSTTQFLLILPG